MDTKNLIPAEERSINIKDIFSRLIVKWYIILIATVAGLLISTVYTFFICTPMYTSTARIYIARRVDEQITTGDLSISTYITRDYAELITDRTVLEEVIEELDLNYSYKALKACVNISNPEATRILNVSVTTNNPRLSMKIAQSVCEVSQQKIVELLNADYVNIISDAYLPASASSPDVNRNLWYGLGAGFILSIAFLMIYSFIDDKINGVNDIEEYLGLSVLGVIPYSGGKSVKRYGNTPARRTTAISSNTAKE